MKIPDEKDRLLLIVLILLLLIGIGFFFPIPANRWFGFFTKVVLFFIVFSILYGLFFSQKWSWIQSRFSESEDIKEVDNLSSEKVTWEGFGKAFKWFYQELLTVIRTGLVASSAGFYLKKGQKGFQLQIGETDQGRVENHHIAAENSYVNLVGKEKKSILEGKLPKGTTLSGIESAEIRSFLGIPLIWDDQSVGVLALGSHVEDNFSIEDGQLLTRFGSLLNQVMTVYHRGLHWEMDHEVFCVHLKLLKMLKKAAIEEDIYNGFVENLKTLFSFERFTLCLKEGQDGVIHYVYGEVNEFDRGLKFPLDEGLNGWIMKRNAPLLIANVSEGDYQRPRYFKEERQKHGMRSFLGIPLGTGEEVWGSLSLESRSVNQFGEKSKEVLIELAMHLEMSRERILLRKRLDLLIKGGEEPLSSNIQIE